MLLISCRIFSNLHTYASSQYCRSKCVNNYNKLFVNYVAFIVELFNKLRHCFHRNSISRIAFFCKVHFLWIVRKDRRDHIYMYLWNHLTSWLVNWRNWSTWMTALFMFTSLVSGAFVDDKICVIIGELWIIFPKCCCASELSVFRQFVMRHFLLPGIGIRPLL